MKPAIIAAVLLSLTALAGCEDPDPPRSRPDTAAPDTGNLLPPAVQIPGCVVGPGGTADTACDPGVTNPAVTQDTLATTICHPGWAEQVRPPTSYTTPLKRLDMARYGLTGPPDDYRYDHLIALSLGGHPTDPRNLWPQPVAEAHVKDDEATQLQIRVCARTLSLVDAQRITLARWTHQHGDVTPR